MPDEVKKQRREFSCFIEAICPICGKEFFPTPEWVYNDGNGGKVCSWHCHCEAKRIREAAEKARGKTYRGVPVEPDRDQNILKLAKEGVPLPKIAVRYHLTKGRILQILRANRE